MLFEDAHWADPTTLDLLGRFVELLSGIPALLVITARPEFNAPLAAHPAVSVPAGLTAAGLPVGLQLVGRYGADRRLLEIAAAIMELAG